MVISGCATTEHADIDLPSIKQIGVSFRAETSIQYRDNEYQCQVSKVQASLLPPWLAVDDGEWRPSGETSVPTVFRLHALTCLFHTSQERALRSHDTHGPHDLRRRTRPELVRSAPLFAGLWAGAWHGDELSCTRPNNRTPAPPLPRAHARAEAPHPHAAKQTLLPAIGEAAPMRWPAGEVGASALRPSSPRALAAVPLPALPQRWRPLGVAPGAPWPKLLLCIILYYII